MNYYSPTPKKWRKIGDAILIGSAAVSGTIMGSPLTDSQKVWAIWICSLIGIIGKVLTNLAKEDTE